MTILEKEQAANIRRMSLAIEKMSCTFDTLVSMTNRIGVALDKLSGGTQTPSKLEANRESMRECARNLMDSIRPCRVA